MNSPAAIDNAPASSPDSPVSSTVRVPAPPPITPSTSAMLLTSPSLAPKTAARRVPDIRARPRAASPRTTSPCIRSSASIAGGTSASGAASDRRSACSISASTKTQPNHRARTPSSRARRVAPGRAHLIPQPALPVRRVPLLGLGQPEQDLAFLTLPAQRQIAVDQRRLPLVGQQAPPPPHPRLRRSGSGPTALVLHRAIVPEHQHRSQHATSRANGSRGAGESATQVRSRRSVAVSRARRERDTARPRAGGWRRSPQEADERVPTAGAGDDEVGTRITREVGDHPSHTADDDITGDELSGDAVLLQSLGLPANRCQPRPRCSRWLWPGRRGCRP